MGSLVNGHSKGRQRLLFVQYGLVVVYVVFGDVF